MLKQYKLIEEFHSSCSSGHMGIRKTISKLKQRYIWKRMRKMAKVYVNSCKKCNRNKITRHIKEGLVLTDTPRVPLGKVLDQPLFIHLNISFENTYSRSQPFRESQFP